MYFPRVPDQYQAALRYLSQELDQDKFLKVKDVLNKAESTSDLESVKVSLSKYIDSLEAAGIIEILIATHLKLERDREPKDEAIKSLAYTLRMFDRSATLEQIGNIEKNLNELVELGSLFQLQAKASDVMNAQERLYREVRIFSDIRPVFPKRDEVTPPVGAVIAHSMKLHYYQDGELKSFHLCLDDSDLQQLDTQVQRAKEKSKALSALLERADLLRIAIE